MMAALHAKASQSWMGAPTAIDGFSLLAVTEHAFTDVFAEEALEPHKGRGHVRVVVMGDGEYFEFWRDMQLLANCGLVAWTPTRRQHAKCATCASVAGAVHATSCASILTQAIRYTTTPRRRAK